MGGGPQRRILTSSAGLGSHFYFGNVSGYACYLDLGKECGGESYGNHISGNITDTTLPVGRGLVEDVVNAETLVLGSERVEVLLEQNILGGDVGKDEVDLGLVASLAAADDGADNLQHGGDAGATGDHAKVTDHVGGVDEGALGAADLDGLSDSEAGQVLADVAGGVRLDQEVEVAGLVVAADGGVRADDLLGATVGLLEDGADGDVLADGEAKDRGGVGKLEPVAGGEVLARCMCWELWSQEFLTWRHCGR